MKRIFAGFAAVLLAVSGAMAAKTMDTSIGKVWTDDKGMTLYVFSKDEANKSNCYDECAKEWPPYLSAADAKAEGKWTLVERTDGSKVWAFDGHPLYTYHDDKKPGDVNGDGVKDEFGEWSAAKEI